MGYFDSFDKASIWMSPINGRLFIFFEATFFQLPSLMREDGKMIICSDPKMAEAMELCNDIPGEYALVYIGEL